VLAVVTALTIIVGNIVALSQTNFKRLMAYSGIANAGYLLLALVSMRAGTASSILYYTAGYSFATIGAFAVAITVFNAKGSEDMSAFNGLGKKNPWLAAALTMCMLSLAGIPPFAGFLGKYYIFSEAISDRQITLTLIAIIASVTGIYYYFKVILAMYTKEPDETAVVPTLSYVVVTTICVLAILALGLFPDPFLNLL
jgi:NADH-quinone oxidoreductase subunit N